MKTSKILDKEISFEQFLIIYKNTETKEKLKFLKQILKNDKNIQYQFVTFVKNNDSDNIEKSEIKTSEIDIDSIASNIFDELSEIDFNTEVENSLEHNYEYDDDDDAVYYAAYNLIAEVLNPYFIDAKELLKKADYLNAFRTMIAICQGAQNLPEPEDDYNLFTEYSEKVNEYVNEYFDEFSNKLSQIFKSNEISIALFDLFFDYYKTKNSEDNIININCHFYLT